MLFVIYCRNSWKMPKSYIERLLTIDFMPFLKFRHIVCYLQMPWMLCYKPYLTTPSIFFGGVSESLQHSCCESRRKGTKCPLYASPTGVWSNLTAVIRHKSSRQKKKFYYLWVGFVVTPYERPRFRNLIWSLLYTWHSNDLV